MKKLFYLLILGFLGYCGYLSTLDESRMPPLRDGDLVFQSSWTPQSMAIGLATSSWYIHTGIIKKTDHGFVVIEAAQKVGEIPLHDWIQRGILHRFALYRYKDLKPEQAAHVLEAAKKYYGRAYDHYFSFDNDDIYCSELIYLAYKDAGLPFAQPEKIGSLFINNPFTKKLIEQRWQNYPACKDKGFVFEQCYSIMMSQELISPSSIAYDIHFERIFTNYPTFDF